MLAEDDATLSEDTPASVETYVGSRRKWTLSSSIGIKFVRHDARSVVLPADETFAGCIR
jgi:hypothetical protein